MIIFTPAPRATAGRPYGWLKGPFTPQQAAVNSFRLKKKRHIWPEKTSRTITIHCANGKKGPAGR